MYRAVFMSVLLSLSLLQAASLKGQNRLIDGEESYRFYVKLRKEAFVDLEAGKVRSFSRTRSVGSDLLTALNEFSYNQVVELNEADRSALRSGTGVRSATGFDKSSMSGLLEMEAARFMDKNELLALAEELESYELVEYCELSPVTPPPPPSINDKVTYISPATASWVDQQFYLYGDNGGDVFGIYADYAWELGITGEGVSIVDIEWGWDYQHEDFAGQNMVDALTTTAPEHNDHGTAVAGQMYAANNGFGVTGAVYGADAFIGISEITKGRPSAIAQALDSLEPGDVLVYEMQTGGGDVNGDNDSYVPADYTQSVWDLTKQATDAGIIVVAAAGNGGEDLDNPYYADYNARGDNGSIIVGAGTRVGRNRTGFSTHGERVNVCGIGDWSIYTTGYGDLYNGGAHATYTKSFAGTSSSTPIVASVVVAIQSYAKSRLNMTLTPIEMRDLLVKTGTPSGTGWPKNTPLPNIRAAIAELDAIHGGERYALAVTNGSGSGDYREGTEVSIVAKDSAGFTFDAWIGDISTVTAADAESTTVTMPAADIALTATYTAIPTYAVTVVNGTGSGKYEEGVVVGIEAKDSLGYIFTEWQGDIQVLNDPSLKRAVLTVPDSAVTLTALYREFTLKKLDQSMINVESVTSEWDVNYGETKANDGDSATFWHCQDGVTLPQGMTFRLESPTILTGFAVLPRQDESENGRIKEWILEVSENGTDWVRADSGAWTASKDEKIEEFAAPTEPVSFVRITALSSTNGLPRVGIAEFNLYSEEIPVALTEVTALPTTLSARLLPNRLALQAPHSGQYEITVMNLRGQQLQKMNVNLQAGVHQLPISSLSQGMVLLSVKTSGSEIVVKQILR